MKKAEIEKLKKCFEDTIWMAIRYANGRHTFAPTIVRDAISNYKMIFPDYKLKPDQTIAKPDEKELGGINFRSDYLYDLFVNEK